MFGSGIGAYAEYIFSVINGSLMLSSYHPLPRYSFEIFEFSKNQITIITIISIIIAVIVKTVLRYRRTFIIAAPFFIVCDIFGINKLFPIRESLRNVIVSLLS